MASASLRWKREQPAMGLARIVQGPLPSWLHDGTTRYAWVSASGRRSTGWYWVAGWGSGVPHMNTCGTPVASEAEAKAAALAYVKQHLGMEAK